MPYPDVNDWTYWEGLKYHYGNLFGDSQKYKDNEAARQAAIGLPDPVDPYGGMLDPDAIGPSYFDLPSEPQRAKLPDGFRTMEYRIGVDGPEDAREGIEPIPNWKPGDGREVHLLGDEAKQQRPEPQRPPQQDTEWIPDENQEPPEPQPQVRVGDGYSEEYEPPVRDILKSGRVMTNDVGIPKGQWGPRNAYGVREYIPDSQNPPTEQRGIPGLQPQPEGPPHQPGNEPWLPQNGFIQTEAQQVAEELHRQSGQMPRSVYEMAKADWRAQRSGYPMNITLHEAEIANAWDQANRGLPSWIQGPQRAIRVAQEASRIQEALMHKKRDQAQDAARQMEHRKQEQAKADTQRSIDARAEEERNWKREKHQADMEVTRQKIQDGKDKQRDKEPYKPEEEEKHVERIEQKIEKTELPKEIERLEAEAEKQFGPPGSNKEANRALMDQKAEWVKEQLAKLPIGTVEGRRQIAEDRWDKQSMPAWTNLETKKAWTDLQSSFPVNAQGKPNLGAATQEQLDAMEFLLLKPRKFGMTRSSARKLQEKLEEARRSRGPQ